MSAAWVDRLERRLGFIEIPNLAAFMAGMNGLCAVLRLLKPEFPFELVLDPTALWHGQVWRVFTFILVPPDMPGLWLLLWLGLYFAYLTVLEREFGSFRFTLYVLIGALAASVATLVSGFPLDSQKFVISLFLAFARLNPNLEILLFFFFPVRMKWLARFTWAWLAWQLIFGYYDDRLTIVSGLLNYALFFGGEHAFELRQLWRRSRRAR